MENVITVETFFLVATVVVAVVGILMTIALIYFLKILADIRHISKRARREGVAFLEDVRSALVKTATNVPKMIGLVGVVAKMFGFMKDTKKKRRTIRKKKSE